MMSAYVVKNGWHVSRREQGKDRHDPECELFRDRSLLRPPMPFVEHPTLLGKMMGPPFGLQLFFCN
jgi:hypothetical protein